MRGSEQFARIGETTRERGCCGGDWADEVGSAAGALAAFVGAIAGAGAALLGTQDVAVHAEAHRASGAVPLEPCRLEDFIQTFLFRQSADRRRTRHDHRADSACHVATLDHSGSFAQILDARIGAAADEHGVDLQILHRGAGLEAHVHLGAGFGGIAGFGDFARDVHRHRRSGSPADLRHKGVDIQGFQTVEGGSGFGREGAGVGNHPLERLALGGKGAILSGNELEGGVVGGDHAGAGPHFDAHVADRHAAAHAERLDGFTAIFGDIARGSARSELADNGEDDVFRRDSVAQTTSGFDSERLGLFARSQGLGRQDVLDLAGADAEGQCAEGSVGGGVAVSADNGESGQRDAELGADDVDDALARVIVAEERDAELLGVLIQSGELLSAEGALVDGAAIGRDVVIDGGKSEIGAADGPLGFAETIEGLRRGDLVDKVAVDVEERTSAGEVAHHVALPHLVEQRLCHIVLFYADSGENLSLVGGDAGVQAGKDPVLRPIVECFWWDVRIGPGILIVRVGSCPSGQWEQTVNLSANAFAGSNPALPTTHAFN